MKILVDGKDLYSLTKDELNQVRNQVHDAWDFLERKTSLTFRVGMAVSFESRRGFTVYGVITKVNQKTVMLKQVDSRTTWKVSPSLLKLVTDPNILTRTK